MPVSLILLIRNVSIEIKLEFIGLALLVVSGSEDGPLLGRIERRRRQRHDGEVAGVVAADGVGDAVLAIVTDFEDFLGSKRNVLNKSKLQC